MLKTHKTTELNQYTGQGSTRVADTTHTVSAQHTHTHTHTHTRTRTQQRVESRGQRIGRAGIESGYHSE
jgi:hypothetical protein